jgi:hypothetical protein
MFAKRFNQLLVLAGAFALVFFVAGCHAHGGVGI